MSNWQTYSTLFDSFDRDEEIEDREKDVTLSLDLPGHDPESIKVAVENRILNVDAERKGRKFSKRYRLADSLDSTRIDAKYEHGVLMIEIPKRTEARAQSITVRVK